MCAYVRYSNYFSEVHWKKEVKSAGLRSRSFLIELGVINSSALYSVAAHAQPEIVKQRL